MGAHLKLGRPLSIEVHGVDKAITFEDLDEVNIALLPCHPTLTSMHCTSPSLVQSTFGLPCSDAHRTHCCSYDAVGVSLWSCRQRGGASVTAMCSKWSRTGLMWCPSY